MHRTSPTVFTNAYFGVGSGSVLLSNLACRGTENDVFQCPNSGWGVQSCSHSQDVGVRCTNSKETAATINL